MSKCRGCIEFYINNGAITPSYFSQSVGMVVFQYSNFTQNEQFNTFILYSAPRKHVPDIKG